MSLARERATDKADLPHAYDETKGTSVCRLCGGGVLDARHGDWEKALEQEPAEPSIPRELGA